MGYLINKDDNSLFGKITIIFLMPIWHEITFFFSEKKKEIIITIFKKWEVVGITQFLAQIFPLNECWNWLFILNWSHVFNSIKCFWLKQLDWTGNEQEYPRSQNIFLRSYKFPHHVQKQNRMGMTIRVRCSMSLSRIFFLLSILLLNWVLHSHLQLLF